MNLKDIQEQWDKDSKIDIMNLGNEAVKTAVLHAKYLKELSNTRLRIRKAESDFFRIRLLRSRYYRGELSREELVVHGWSQYLGTRPIKAELEQLLESDENIIALVDKIEYLKTTHSTLELILKSLHSRTWDVKSAIEWEKFRNGSF